MSKPDLTILVDNEIDEQELNCVTGGGSWPPFNWKSLEISQQGLSIHGEGFSLTISPQFDIDIDIDIIQVQGNDNVVAGQDVSISGA